MATKKLYFHPRRGAVEVKQGFCWPAFFFGSVWALARRIYPLFFVMLLVDLVLWFGTGYAKAHGSSGLALLSLLFAFAYAIVRGMRGNRWVESFLVARGYVLRSGNAGIESPLGSNA